MASAQITPENGSRRRDRQVVRILSILRSLLDGGRPSVRELAAKFGTRRETIYRDLKALEDAGYPVCGDESGCLSRPRLLPETARNTPELRFSDDEIAALLWASQRSAGLSPLGEPLGSAVTKLQTMARAEEAAAVSSVVTKGGWGVKDYGPHRETILTLVEAILRRSRCRVEYAAAGAAQAKTYDYDSYHLLEVSGCLYCIGRVPSYENLTTLAVDRIRGLEVSGDHFEVDTAFDAETYRRESFGVIWEEPRKVTIRFRKDQAPYVKERLWHPTQELRELAGGGLELSFTAGGTFEITRWILGWGDAAEVVEPEDLRDHVGAMLKRAAGVYTGVETPATAEQVVRCS